MGFIVLFAKFFYSINLYYESLWSPFFQFLPLPDPKNFNSINSQFQDETKFELCDTIRTVLRSYPKSNFDGDDIVWMPMLQQGLHDILFSRLGKKQRDPAMMLVASVIEVSDFQWCLNNYEPR